MKIVRSKITNNNVYELNSVARREEKLEENSAKFH